MDTDQDIGEGVDTEPVQINSPKHKKKPEYSLVENKDVSLDFEEFKVVLDKEEEVLSKFNINQQGSVQEDMQSELTKCLESEIANKIDSMEFNKTMEDKTSIDNMENKKQMTMNTPSKNCEKSDCISDNEKDVKPKQVIDVTDKHNSNILGSNAGSRPQSFSSSSSYDTSRSSQSNMADFCRICHCETDPDLGPLITPCYCSGSLRYVHQSCLQQWIKSSDSKHCELCGYHFVMDSKLKPFRKWEKLSMSQSERRKIICSVMFHVIAITCVVWSLYVLIERTADEIRTGKLHWPFWTKLVVVAIGITGGLVFMYVQCKVYVLLWKRLKAFNRVIYVQNHTKDTNTQGKLSETIPVIYQSTTLDRRSDQCTSTTHMGQRSHSVIVEVCDNTAT